MQMDYNDFQLYKTPVVLTLQGEFEDEDMNNIVTKPVHERLKERFEKKYGYEEGVEEDEDEDDEDWEEVTVDELIKLEGIDEEDFEDGDDFNEDDEYDDDEEEVDQENDDEIDQEDPNKDFRSFLNSSPVGKTIDEKYNSLPDYSIYRPEKPDISDIPEDAFVTDEDAKGLRRAHRRADRLFEYASDIAMIASFHFKKKNFHLVKLLDPIFLIGKRIMDIKGYYFTLLDEDETERVKLSSVRPVIEKLVEERAKMQASSPPPAEKPDDWRKRSRRSRRRWSSRQKDKENRGFDGSDAGEGGGTAPTVELKESKVARQTSSSAARGSK
eukprot:gene916-1027_t